jgi:restriction system protein
MSVSVSTIRGVVRVRICAALALTAGLAAYFSGVDVGWSVAAALTAPAAVWAAPRFVRGALTGLRTPGRREQPTESMTGLEFEDYVARIARGCGVPVIMTPLSGDWGVDLIVGRRPNRIAVQCKRQSRPVGPGAVQEVVAGASMQDCTATMVVSNQTFTPAAQRLAEHHGCTLVGGPDLPYLHHVIKRLTSA